MIIAFFAFLRLSLLPEGLTQNKLRFSNSFQKGMEVLAITDGVPKIQVSELITPGGTYGL